MLQIGLGTGTSPVPLSDRPSLSLDDDGYYWFIEPLFRELAEQTGQYVALYGNAWFIGDDLLALERTLHQAIALVAVQPESWGVVVGHAGARGEVWMGVLKPCFVTLLETWLALCVQARESGQALVCFGD